MNGLGCFRQTFWPLFEYGIAMAWRWLKAARTPRRLSASFGRSGGCTNLRPKSGQGPFDTTRRQSGWSGGGFFPLSSVVQDEIAGQEQQPVGDSDQSRPQLRIAQGRSSKVSPEQVLLDKAIKMFDSITAQIAAPVGGKTQRTLPDVHQPQVSRVAPGAACVQTTNMDDGDGLVGRLSEMDRMPDGDFEASQLVITQAQRLIWAKPGFSTAQVQGWT